MANQMDLFRGGTPTEFRDLLGNSRRLNRFFEDFFGRLAAPLEDIASIAPAVEIEETEDHYVIAAEMPGVAKENIDIEASGNRLRIFGEKGAESRGSREGRSREYRRFEEVITLPGDVDTTQVDAEYRDGILYIVVPKVETQKTKKIEVKSGSGLLDKLRSKVTAAIQGSSSTDGASSDQQREGSPRDNKQHQESVGTKDG